MTIAHVDGKRNPADLFTKEYKDDQLFRDIRDVLVTPAPRGWGVLG